MALDDTETQLDPPPAHLVPALGTRRLAGGKPGEPASVGGVRLTTWNILHGRSPGDGRVGPERLWVAVAGLDADVLAPAGGRPAAAALGRGG